jgi:hypothetical protein
MAYSDFKDLLEIEKKLGFENRVTILFEKVEPIEPSERLKNELLEAREFPIRSEKAKSEWLIVPILREVRNLSDRFITIYSGDNLNVDEAKGLKGECDFIIAKDEQSFEVNLPILQVVEAKKGEVEFGVPQCVAQMIGAKIFNEQNNVVLKTVYGCVTTGDDWLFLRLGENVVFIDNRKYYLGNLGELLGVFGQIIQGFKTELG